MEDVKTRGMDLEAFQADDLFQLIKGRTLWLVGDSQMERWYGSIECLLAKFLVDAPRHAPLADTSGNLWLMNLDDRLLHRGGAAFPPKMSICAHYQGGTRVCNTRINQATELAAPVLRVLQDHVPDLARDIAVMNAGLHYGINGDWYHGELEVFTEHVKRHREALPLIIWKDTPPQHFEFERGYYWWADGSGKGLLGNGKHERCRPMTEEELGSEEMRAGGWYNKVATPVVRAAGIPILDTYHETLPLWDFHLSDQDCTHCCFPGPYEVWTYMLTDLLKTLEPRSLSAAI